MSKPTKFAGLSKSIGTLALILVVACRFANGNPERVGLAEFAVTAVPEPASLAGGLLGVMLIAARRRR